MNVMSSQSIERCGRRSVLFARRPYRGRRGYVAALALLLAVWSAAGAPAAVGADDHRERAIAAEVPAPAVCEAVCVLPAPAAQPSEPSSGMRVPVRGKAELRVGVRHGRSGYSPVVVGYRLSGLRAAVRVAADPPGLAE